jgi:ribosome-associated translation inhibitor RaiA
MRNDIEDKVENNNYMLESVARKDVLKATITLHNFLLQYENTTLDLFNALRKVRDEIQKTINFKRKQVSLESYFTKAS